MELTNEQKNKYDKAILSVLNVWNAITFILGILVLSAEPGPLVNPLRLLGQGRTGELHPLSIAFLSVGGLGLLANVVFHIRTWIDPLLLIKKKIKKYRHKQDAENDVELQPVVGARTWEKVSSSNVFLPVFMTVLTIAAGLGQGLASKSVSSGLLLGLSIFSGCNWSLQAVGLTAVMKEKPTTYRFFRPTQGGGWRSIRVESTSIYLGQKSPERLS